MPKNGATIRIRATPEIRHPVSPFNANSGKSVYYSTDSIHYAAPKRQFCHDFVTIGFYAGSTFNNLKLL
jgi:hypothetical protein